MKHLPIILALAATPALAQPAPPDTLILPTATINNIATILKAMPYDQVASVMIALEACVTVQMPDKSGKIVDRGQCPPVTAALHPRPAPVEPSAETPKP